MRQLSRSLSALAIALIAAIFTGGAALAQEPLRIGVITFLSGPAAGPFGLPAKNAADLLAEALNQGGQIPGYGQKGFGGRPIELVYVDEAGGPTKVVTEYRNLVDRQNVDLVIGVISSGDCLAVAPVAEEMKKFTVLFDCATNRIFEEGSYKYVFRTTTMATQENVAAARYITEYFPNLKTFSGIDPNYAWGQDAWADFTEAMKILKPQSQIATIVWPKLGASQYGAEVSALLGSGGEVIQNGLWGGDLEAYTVRNVDGKVTLINVKYYQPELISPPDGMKSVDWIRSGFKRP
jgi:branched-chain amino acid transport system substrate-binding protein